MNTVLMQSWRTWVGRVILLGMLGLASGPVLQAQPLALGSVLPEAPYTLKHVNGEQHALDTYFGPRGTVVLFWSNQCPWSDRYETRVVRLARAFGAFGISFILINANDATAFPKERMQEGQRLALRYGLPYLLDEQGAFARAMAAERTPHAFVFDHERRLVYRGAIDDMPTDAAKVKVGYLQDALNALRDEQEILAKETKAFGCLIRYRQ